MKVGNYKKKSRLVKFPPHRRVEGRELECTQISATIREISQDLQRDGPSPLSLENLARTASALIIRETQHMVNENISHQPLVRRNLSEVKEELYSFTPQVLCVRHSSTAFVDVVVSPQDAKLWPPVRKP